MVYAAIDIGSNTTRMLVADRSGQRILSPQYYRQITRLAGNFSSGNELSPESIQRTLTALEQFHKILKKNAVQKTRIVATAALRRAVNHQFFIDQVKSSTGLDVEIISGEEEASLMTSGVLSVIRPQPEAAILVDIGGGSTELVCVTENKVLFQESYNLGVVQLCEEFAGHHQRQEYIQSIITRFIRQLKSYNQCKGSYQLIGTAGTMTTLAALHLNMDEYNPEIINNHELSYSWIKKTHLILEHMSIPEREGLRGMEAGRGDLILPGLQIAMTLLNCLNLSTIKIADSGLLEGVLLGLPPGNTEQ